MNNSCLPFQVSQDKFLNPYDPDDGKVLAQRKANAVKDRNEKRSSQQANDDKKT